MITGNVTRWGSSLALVACLQACVILPPPLPSVDQVEDMPATHAMTQRQGSAGGVFIDEAAWSLTSDTRAFRVGDVLTVVLNESTQASKLAGTTMEKSSSAGISPITFGGSTIDTSIGINGNRDFSGNATSTQQNRLQGAITVIVQEVLPNGLLLIKGEKSLVLNQGEEVVRLSGYVRPTDVDSDNRLSSQRIANARIVYSGTGDLANTNTPGWLTRFFNSPWMPF